MLVVVLHHIAGDGWSMGPLARDLSVAYAARRAGHGTGVDAAADAVRGLRALAARTAGSRNDPDSLVSRADGVLAAAAGGIPEELELPADRPRPAVASHRGHAVPVRVPAPCTRDCEHWPGRRA